MEGNIMLGKLVAEHLGFNLWRLPGIYKVHLVAIGNWNVWCWLPEDRNVSDRKCLTWDKWRNSSLKCAHSEICYISPIEESCLFRKQSQNQHLGKRRLAHTVMLRAMAVRFGPITMWTPWKQQWQSTQKKKKSQKKKKEKKKRESEYPVNIIPHGTRQFAGWACINGHAVQICHSYP
jgi:hypothetical protein